MLGRHRQCWKELMECMVWIVHNFVEQFIVTLLQQLIEFRQVRRAEAASLASTQKRINSLAVCRGNESAHAGDAYVSRDTTTARKTACRPASVIP